MEKSYYVYILTNQRNTTLYVGITNNLVRRIYEHKNKLVDGFTKKNNLNKLVYFEQTSSVETAIAREKQLKAGSRQKKLDLVNSANSGWCDLYSDIVG